MLTGVWVTATDTRQSTRPQNCSLTLSLARVLAWTCPRSLVSNLSIELDKDLFRVKGINHSKMLRVYMTTMIVLSVVHMLRRLVDN